MQNAFDLFHNEIANPKSLSINDILKKWLVLVLI